MISLIWLCVPKGVGSMCDMTRKWIWIMKLFLSIWSINMIYIFIRCLVLPSVTDVQLLSSHLSENVRNSAPMMQLFFFFLADLPLGLVLIRQKALVGHLPGNHKVYKITKIAVIPLSDEEPQELELEVCIMYKTPKKQNVSSSCSCRNYTQSSAYILTVLKNTLRESSVWFTPKDGMTVVEN